MTEEARTLTDRGTSVCRGCGGSNLVSVLDLGSQPLANEMGATRDTVLDNFPLHLRICPTCGLGQVGEFVRPDRIFSDEYPYLSSTSSSWVEHARSFAARMTDALGLDRDRLVVEIASNDGYLLSQFRALGVPVLGIEPAGNVATIARAAGVDTVHAFFGSERAALVVAERGHPDLVVANNVLAHVPDLHDFLAGISLLVGPETVVTVENPSFTTLMTETQFDTIYHEHFSYLTAHSVAHAAERHGLVLVAVEQLPTHGGSNRYWIRRSGCADVDESVEAVFQHERKAGLFDPSVWESFRNRSRRAIQGLDGWLRERTDAGLRVAAYGAAAKGNTFLNAVGAAAADIAFVVDGSAEKQGRFLPGSRVPVLAPSALGQGQADDVLILPWNLAHEIAPLIRDHAPSARTWVALPAIEQIG